MSGGWKEGAVRGSATPIAASKGAAERVCALGADRIKIISNGIDASAFKSGGKAVTNAERRMCRFGQDNFLSGGAAAEFQGSEVLAGVLALRCEGRTNAQAIYLRPGSSRKKIEEVAGSLQNENPHLPVGIQHALISGEEVMRWQRSAIAPLVCTRPGTGYDFTYPPKVLAALTSGARVDYAGGGPVVDDITEYDLGV